MCGRFSLSASKEILMEHFKITQGFFMKPRYNISPGESLPIIKRPGEIDFLRWGFIPPFKKSADLERGFINVRAETVDEKISFRQAFLKQRCLILADGYYEWKTIGRTKQPFYIHRRDSKPFAIAGIWSNETCGLLTQAANAQLSPLHPRMPVILSVEGYSLWLESKTPIMMLKGLLNPREEVFEIYPVTPQMNHAKFESPLCIQSLQ